MLRLKMRFFSRIMRRRLLVASFMLLIVNLIILYIFIEVSLLRKGESVKISVSLTYVVVHLDLKGSPPKLSYLKSLLPILKKQGANGILIEYEDMFPYEGRLVNLSATNSYKKKELADFIRTAVDAGFEIIPLIQTFGHMEFALKLEEFRHLREEPKYPDSICPSKQESRYLIKDMLEQVINFHKEIAPVKFFHIGCDEVFHINKCEQCHANGNISDRNVFINHVKFVSTLVQLYIPNTKILIWDDMFRGMSPLETIDYKFRNTQPVYWDYKATSLDVSHSNLFKYHKLFDDIWIASAYKGADGSTATIPNLKNRFNNHINWLDFIHNYRFGGEYETFNFKGIILTGWSRYNHMGPPCELLPVSFPSLTLNLILIEKFRTGIIRENNLLYDSEQFISKYIETDFNNGLQCKDSLVAGVDLFDASSCFFDGAELYDVLENFLNTLMQINSGDISLSDVLDTVDLIEMGYVNMNSLVKQIDWCTDIMVEIKNIEMRTIEAMTLYYDMNVVEEYVNFKIRSVKRNFTKLLQILTEPYNNHNWQRRSHL